MGLRVVLQQLFKNQESQKNNAEKEKIDLEKQKLQIEIDKLKPKDEAKKEGSGLYYDRYFGKGLRDSILNSIEYKNLNKTDRRIFKELLNKLGKNKIKLIKSGNGLYFDLDERLKE